MFILTVELPKKQAEETAQWIAENWEAYPVEIERPKFPFVWLESYFDAYDQAMLAGHAVAETFDLPWNVRPCEDRDWTESWKEHFKPMLIGKRLWVCPHWIDEAPPVENGIRIDINPGLSFGTGNHFTTHFCLATIEELLESGKHQSLLDLGAGSGILSIAAAKLGCTSIRAIEVDPLAVNACQKNLELNGVQDSVTVETRDLATDPLDEPCSLVVANIYDHFLIEHARTILAACSDTLILSGIRTPHLDAVAETFLIGGAREIRRDADHEWSGLVLDCSP